MAFRGSRPAKRTRRQGGQASRRGSADQIRASRFRPVAAPPRRFRLTTQGERAPMSQRRTSARISAQRDASTAEFASSKSPDDSTMLRSAGRTRSLDEGEIVEDGIPLLVAKAPVPNTSMPSTGLSPRDQRAMALLVVLCAEQCRTERSASDTPQICSRGYPSGWHSARFRSCFGQGYHTARSVYSRSLAIPTRSSCSGRPSSTLAIRADTAGGRAGSSRFRPSSACCCGGSRTTCPTCSSARIRTSGRSQSSSSPSSSSPLLKGRH